MFGLVITNDITVIIVPLIIIVYRRCRLASMMMSSTPAADVALPLDSPGGDNETLRGDSYPHLLLHLTEELW